MWVTTIHVPQELEQAKPTGYFLLLYIVIVNILYFRAYV